LNQRYYSLDVFRGATVALMILVNNPGSWSHIYSPLEHAPWHGLTPTDLVFPFFLFAVGNAMAFVMPRFEAAGDGAFWRKVLKRTILIFLIGLFLNWGPFVRWQDDHLVAKTWTWMNDKGEIVGIRILGVLQRIALSYFFASIIVYYGKARGAFLTGLLILLIYWLLCILGNPSDPYSLQGWFGTAIDKSVLGDPHMYHGEGIAFDPEGLIHTLPSIVQVIFGYLVGDYIIKKGKTYGEPQGNAVNVFFGPYQMLTGLFVAAVALLFTGYCWNLSFPVNKKIWTSSYVVATTGMAILVLATLIYAIEIRGMRGWWSRFFDVFGKNPLFIFFLSGFLPRVLALIRIPGTPGADGKPHYLSPFGWFYETICAKVPGSPENGSLLYAICMIFFYWAIVYWMDKRRIYVKV
jgi:predicted acyltransferase